MMMQWCDFFNCESFNIFIFSRLRIIYDSNLRFFLSQLLYEKSLNHTLDFESHEKRI